ncbi:MAG: hypothetical protein EA367_08060 [Leptolyngbya sp. DLM2.Bin15]|nr:MAG: hypothetical protein EA367_08060 [Leptolyngbya sp. DLM2.Bin15]
MESSHRQSYIMWMRPSRLNRFGDGVVQQSNTLLTLSAKLRTNNSEAIAPLPVVTVAKPKRSMPHLELLSA